ncbi:MAG: class I SAM-dependent methyltransferase [Anaerolineae bacterium]|nr:class I SAM-dependent methyltransferase [Anaerolineae bacterium]
MLDRIRHLLPTISLKTLTSIEAYDQWATTYPPRAHNVLMSLEEDAMLRLMPTLANQRVLDLACGSGRYGRLALEQGAKSVTGLDNSPAMLQANQHGQRVLATVGALPLPQNCMDIILCGLALGHLPSLLQPLAEIGRVLKSGGIALISDFHPFVFFNGGQRTFTGRDGRVYAVEHYPHLYADYHNAAMAANLLIEGVLEPVLDNGSGEIPIILALRLRKL